MNIPPITVSDYSFQVQQALEMKLISTSMSQINDAHEERKKEIDEINKQSLS